MAKSKSPTQSATRLVTYAELEAYVHAFAEGRLNLVLLLGRPGTGKSRAVRSIVGDRAEWIEGNGTAFGLYQAAFFHRNRPFVLDDVDGIDRDERGIRLLKALCQTDPVKRISWVSNAPALRSCGIPSQFKTSSRLLIIVNQWQTHNENVLALEDRAHVIQFEPSAIEVHRKVAGWFQSQDVFDLGVTGRPLGGASGF